MIIQAKKESNKERRKILKKGKKKNLKDPFKLIRIEIENYDITGVYFLFESNKLIYIGQSINIHIRIKQHISEEIKQFDSFSYIECDEKKLNRLEEQYIWYYNPPLNKTLSKILSKNKKLRINKIPKKLINKEIINGDLILTYKQGVVETKKILKKAI